jgi:5-dehydro-2-deoxygluconokinase
MYPKKFDLLTMGRSSIDLYAREVGAAFVDIESFAAYVGGSPTNIAVGAARLGLRTAVLTAVGEDPVGDFITTFLDREGVDTSFIPRKKGARSSAVVLGIQPPDRFPLVFYRDNAADTRLTIDDVLAAPIAESRYLELSGTGLSREPGRTATFLAAERARAAGTVVMLDIDFRADQWDDPRAFGVAVRSILPLIDIVIGTEEEVMATTMTDPAAVQIIDSQISSPTVIGDIELSISRVLSYGINALIVKRGERGATVRRPGEEAMEVPGFPVDVHNVLGAGDAFAAGLVYGLVNDWDWYRAVRMGNAAGAIVVTRHGCANSMATLEEVSDFVRGRGGLVPGSADFQGVL